MKKFFWGGGTVLGGLGAAAAFFLDPRSGRRRRVAVVSKSTDLVRRERAHVTAMVSAVRPGGNKLVDKPVADDSDNRESQGGQAHGELADAVRSAVRERYGDVVDRIGVRVSGSTVTLRGEVAQLRQITGVAEVAETVAGVAEVNNLLRLEMAS